MMTSALYGRMQEAVSQLRALQHFGSDKGIEQCLKLSYRHLADDPSEEPSVLQLMFLDIAWMMLGMEREKAEWLLEVQALSSSMRIACVIATPALP